MSDPFYTARASVAKVDGIHRRATLEDGTEVDFGVHGPIKSHFRLDAEPVAGPHSSSRVAPRAAKRRAHPSRRAMRG